MRYIILVFCVLMFVQHYNFSGWVLFCVWVVCSVIPQPKAPTKSRKTAIKDKSKKVTFVTINKQLKPAKNERIKSA